MVNGKRPSLALTSLTFENISKTYPDFLRPISKFFENMLGKPQQGV